MNKKTEMLKAKPLTKKQKDDIFSSKIPGILQYHQLMLADGVRNKLLYKAITQHLTSETNFLDIGAGTGVWAILAAKLGAKRVVAIEIEECLIPIIFKHAQENGVAHKIEIIHGNSDDVKIRGKFDLIVSELFGGDALGEATVKSFVSLRNRFLAPNGVLIPQKLTMYAVPSKIEKSIQDISAELPIKSEYLKSLKLNYAQNIPLTERQKIEFLAEPQKIIEIDFRTVENAPSISNCLLTWKLDNLLKANAFTVFNKSTFTDEIIMDSFNSQSWGTTTYEFKPFAETSGEIKFDITMEANKVNWSVSLPSHTEIKTQSYSPLFAPTRLRMAQQMTPHRKVRPPKLIVSKTKSVAKPRVK
jgi:predicted RNA methylase